MSKELKELIEIGLKYGLDVSTLTEEQAKEIMAEVREWRAMILN
jgi:hypothetical protein